MKPARWLSQPKIVCCGVISSQGNVYYKLGVRSFNSEDFKDVLRRVREALPNKRLALLLDNCR